MNEKIWFLVKLVIVITLIILLSIGLYNCIGALTLMIGLLQWTV